MTSRPGDEEGGDTLGELPSSSLSRSLPITARPSLHGLEREFSTRLGATSDNHGGKANDAKVPTFTDYLRAQRAIYHSNRKNFSRSAVDPNANEEATAGNHATAPTTPQTSMAVASAVAKLRKRSQPPNVNASSSTSGAYAAANFARMASSDGDVVISSGEQRALQALGALERRGSVSNFNGGGDLDDQATLLHDLETLDEDGHGHDHDGILPWYSPPIQRQRWDKDQILPHVNWGDLFFDLFYVAMAYNLGVMLISSLNGQHYLRGAIYYIGTFGPLWNSWETSMFYSSRYTTVDYAHRLFEVVRYLFVSTAIVHITSVEKMAKPHSIDVLVFTIAVLCESIMHLSLNVELYCVGLGETDAIRNHTTVKIKHEILPMVLMNAAAFVVAVLMFAKTEGDGAHRLLAAAADHGSYEVWELFDLPLTLTAIGYLQNLFFSTITNFEITSGKRGDIRERFVPNNVDYVIHRYGEWILLMIGEGILSLLIVETVERKAYYFITTFGVLTVIFVQILKFESEPSHAEFHAIWQSFISAMCYSYLMQVLSMALIVFGVTYKLFLNDVVKEAAEDAYDAYGGGSKASRMLAASPTIPDEVTAHVFSIGLSGVVLALELMSLTHCGIEKAFKHMVRPKGSQDETSTPHWPIVIIALFKVGIILVTMTLSQWTTDPATLTICGFCIVLALSITRVMNFFYIHKKEVIQNLSATIRRGVKEKVEKASERASEFGMSAMSAVPL
mmetsp:Transcript_9273/g.19554  ORF Transcript_9273/g.19554 Transcript_9273/m.19554 type:complete len:733 (-) Transcript_9273:105-2303(-)